MLTAPAACCSPAPPSLPLLGTAAMAQDKGLITIIVNDPANPYWFTEGEVAKATAEEMGYSATVAAHTGDTNTESNLIDTAITNQSVAIILDPANADGSIGNIQKAVDAGIPVILVNAEINQEGLANAQLVSNNAQGAALGAQPWVEIVGDTGNYVELVGAPSDNNAATRSNGYMTVLSPVPRPRAGRPGGRQLGPHPGLQQDAVPAAGQPRPQGVISGNDEMALGAIAALKEAGRLEGVTVGGFDGSPDAVDAVKAGEMAYTVLQPVAVFSAEAIRQVDSYITAGATGVGTEKQSFDCILITKDNVDKMTRPLHARQASRTTAVGPAVRRPHGSAPTVPRAPDSPP